MPVLQIRKEIGEVTKLLPEECISECIVEEIIDDHILEIRDHIDELVTPCPRRWKEAGIHNEGRVRSG